VKKKIAIGLSVVILLVIMAGALFWYWTGQPLYKPGMVRSAEGSSYTLIPPAPSEEASRMYADLFPNAEFQIIKNTSHFPFSENPETFSKIVGNFLQDLN
jgi:pimeloyl-ACP methyl ester carboxylesterase